MKRFFGSAVVALIACLTVFLIVSLEGSTVRETVQANDLLVAGAASMVNLDARQVVSPALILPADFALSQQLPVTLTFSLPDDPGRVYALPALLSLDFNFSLGETVGGLITPNMANLRGTVYQDADGNGAYDLGVDTPLPGAYITLRDPSTKAVVRQAYTQTDGKFFFAQLQPGIYLISEEGVPPNYALLTPNIQALSLPADFITEWNFGHNLIPPPTSTPTPVPPPMVTVNSDAANVRQGPGLNYEVVAVVNQGDQLLVLARNANSTWFQVRLPDGRQGWISGVIVSLSIAPENLSVNQNVPPTPTPRPTPTPVPAEVARGQEFEVGGWQMKVTEVHKRKVVYQNSNSYWAQGYFLVVILDAVNIQTGTDRLDRNLTLRLVDRGGNPYWPHGVGSSYAQWQYGGLWGLNANVNPGRLVRVAIAFDLPGNVGEVLLETGQPVRVNLGNFAQMPLED